MAFDKIGMTHGFEENEEQVYTEDELYDIWENDYSHKFKSFSIWFNYMRRSYQLNKSSDGMGYTFTYIKLN